MPRPGGSRIWASSDRMPENRTAMTERAVRGSMPKSSRRRARRSSRPSAGRDRRWSCRVARRRRPPAAGVKNGPCSSSRSSVAPMNARSLGSNCSGAASTSARMARSMPARLPPVEGDEQVVLVREVLVDERPRHAGPIGDHAHRDGAGTDLVDQRLGDVEQRLAALVGGEPLGPPPCSLGATAMEACSHSVGCTSSPHMV